MKLASAMRRLRDEGRRRRLAHRLSPQARQVQHEKLTYLRPERLRALEWCASEVERLKVPGDFLECGVALGGSAVVLACAMGDGRTFHGYDVFGTIPAPSADDPPAAHERYAIIQSGAAKGIRGDTYYGYRDDLREHVADTLQRFGIPADRFELHEGLFDETLEIGSPIALAHIDSDWFDPVDCCLRRIGPHLSPGGFMVLDDYLDYGGARKAADAFVAEHPGQFVFQRFSTNVAIHRPR
jgi:O-methyltransferase